MANGAVDELIYERTMDLLGQRITMSLRQRENAKMLIREAKDSHVRAKGLLEEAELELAAWSDLADTAGIRVAVDFNGRSHVYGR